MEVRFGFRKNKGKLRTEVQKIPDECGAIEE